MVDPFTCRYFDRTDAELEEFILFCIAVAGKTASTVSRQLDEFLTTYKFGDSPFETILSFRRIHSLMNAMKKQGIGCYTLKSKGWQWMARSGLNLRECSVEDLEQCPGIGMKTSRFFIIHSRENVRVACLDTHILKYLREQGHDAPRSTPPKRRYLELEQVFLEDCDRLGMTPHQLDIDLWNRFTKSK